MSVVTLQLGQCGNQIGFEFYDLLSKSAMQPKHAPSSSVHGVNYFDLVAERFFYVSNENEIFARAVMVDMEQKVIGQAFVDAKHHTTWNYHKDAQVTGKKGSGNNWAQGYCHHGPKCIADVLDKVSKEVERCDSLGGFLALMSLAGGTGSGLGAFVTTALRDEYPHAAIVNNVIWPYTTGEVIVQNYNAVLTLSHLYSSSDGIIFMENEKMQMICTQLLKIKNVSFKDINKVVAAKLAGVLLPAFEMSDSTCLAKFVISDVLSNVCAHPGYKLLNILNIPVVPKTSLMYTSYNWDMLVKHCRQMLIANANMEEGINWSVKLPKATATTNQVSAFNKSLSNQIFLRGKDANSVELSSFQEPQLYASWVPSYGRFHSAWQRNCFNEIEQSVTLLSNSQTTLKPLNAVVGKAWSMFASRAYVHQYAKHGILEDDFVDSFVALEQVIKNYTSL
ncbi:tubulin delta chain-like [Dendronephthya gigantea]|uniref:tubulin delta chain-like n=1 Tax=Dendronephthya gigantea TaxID=151771 RepID=UPI00106B0C3D|nr:tubulin delta chain-like [Dendronephthya gigantea]